MVFQLWVVLTLIGQNVIEKLQLECLSGLISSFKLPFCRYSGRAEPTDLLLNQEEVEEEVNRLRSSNVVSINWIYTWHLHVHVYIIYTCICIDLQLHNNAMYLLKLCYYLSSQLSLCVVIQHGKLHDLREGLTLLRMKLDCYWLRVDTCSFIKHLTCSEERSINTHIYYR